MLRSFQLAAIVREGVGTRLLNIPLHRQLQKSLAAEWQIQLEEFLAGVVTVAFDPGYQPEADERFLLQGFQAPDWLAGEDSQSISSLDNITSDDRLLAATKGIVALARNDDGEEILLFQKFNRAHVIRPGRFLFLRDDTYETVERPGVTLDGKLSAIYFPGRSELLFHNFRTVNTFLPLADLYEEASEEQIRDVLGHRLLDAEDADALASNANQWFRKRFAMLRDSGVLDTYTAKQIQGRSKGYDVAIRLSGGRIVFPADTAAAKKLLQFLNEELYRGAITDRLFETNSKRTAD